MKKITKHLSLCSKYLYKTPLPIHLKFATENRLELYLNRHEFILIGSGVLLRDLNVSLTKSNTDIITRISLFLHPVAIGVVHSVLVIVIIFQNL